MDRIFSIRAFGRAGLATAGLLLTGCITTNLEFDRMTGTAFPTQQTLNGEDWTLEKIYVEAGHLVVVDQDDTNIAPLNSGGTQQDCITDAELDALEAANRDTQVGPTSFACSIGPWDGTCTRYFAYGVVVDHWGHCTGSCSSTLLGCMWDTTDRGAFAIYYKNSTISSDGQKYLRTTAHELGHAFNLHHSDGDGSTTIMNTTGTVGNTFNYLFTANSETHLSDHPAACRYPGTGAWAEVATEHAGWHGWSATCP